MPDMWTSTGIHAPVPIVPHLLSRVGAGGTDTWSQEGELVRPLGQGDATKAFVVLNPVAGNSDVNIVRQALEEHLGNGNWHYEIHETTGQERLADVVCVALDQGFDAFVAAGGDGTVSGVVSGLVHSKHPLAIIPVGTGNTLARELDIPLNVEDALGILVGDHEVRTIDAIQIGDRFFVLNVGVDVSAVMMRDTRRENKRRLGLIAYLWTGLKKLICWQAHRFAVVVDGQKDTFRASEVVVANSGAIGDPAFRWGHRFVWMMVDWMYAWCGPGTLLTTSGWHGPCCWAGRNTIPICVA